MARVDKNNIIGAVGNLVFYTMNGKNYVRSKPSKRPKKRNQPAPEVNTVFGIVSSYGSAMIKALGSNLLYKLKLTDYNRLRGWMRNQYSANYQLSNWPLVAYTARTCQVNALSDLRDHFFVDIAITEVTNEQIKLLIPALIAKKQIKAPAKTSKVVIKAIAINSPFAKGASKTCTIGMAKQIFDFTDKLQPATELIIPISTNGVQIIAIEYIIKSTVNEVIETREEWLPATVIAIGRY